MARWLALVIAGDVMLGRLVDKATGQQGFSYPWGEVLPVLLKSSK